MDIQELKNIILSANKNVADKEKATTEMLISFGIDESEAFKFVETNSTFLSDLVNSGIDESNVFFNFLKIYFKSKKNIKPFLNEDN